MYFPDKFIKRRLENVYFLWGRGKTTIANRLQQRYGGVIYSTDDARDRLYQQADPAEQPYMCRDFENEYGVTSFWELPKAVIADREVHYLQEMTPMVIAELLVLAQQYPIVFCEGDLDYRTAASVATHAVYLCNRSTTFDWFNRPDHADALDSIRNRADLTEEEKQERIRAAYDAVAVDETTIPVWVEALGIRCIVWDDRTTAAQTAQETALHFGLDPKDAIV